MIRRKGQAGFSIIELLISMGIVVVMFYLGTIVFGSYSARDQLDLATGRVISALNEAQARSWANYSQGAGVGLDHGVYFEERAMIIFSGSEYSEGESANQRFILPERTRIESIEFADSQVVFEALTGRVVGFVAGSDTIIIADDHSQQEVEVTVNPLGVVSVVWQP